MTAAVRRQPTPGESHLTHSLPRYNHLFRRISKELITIVRRSFRITFRYAPGIVLLFAPHSSPRNLALPPYATLPGPISLDTRISRHSMMLPHALIAPMATMAQRTIKSPTCQQIRPPSRSPQTLLPPPPHLACLTVPHHATGKGGTSILVFPSQVVFVSSSIRNMPPKSKSTPASINACPTPLFP